MKARALVLYSTVACNIAINCTGRDSSNSELIGVSPFAVWTVGVVEEENRGLNLASVDKIVINSMVNSGCGECQCDPTANGSPTSRHAVGMIADPRVDRPLRPSGLVCPI